MKAFIFLATLLILEGASAQFIAGRRIKPRAIKPPSDVCAANTGLNFYCNGSPSPICDATGVVQCSGKRGITLECPATRPYCTTPSAGRSTCSATRDPSCSGLPDNSFLCFEEKVYPDPEDCQKYFNCAKDETGELIADAYECDPFYTFDALGPNGRYCRWRGFCNRLDCRRGGNIRMLYAGMNIFTNVGDVVATCISGSKPIVTRCSPGYWVTDINSFPAQCNINCRREGNRYEYPGNDTLYYECSFNSRRVLEARVRSCFRGQYFNTRLGNCEPRSNTPAPPTTTVAPTPAPTSAPTEPATSAATSSSTDAATTASTEAATSSSTDAATTASTDAATSSSTDAATSSSTDAATSSSTDAATSLSTDAATSSSTDAATTASTDAATSSSTDAATSSSTDAATTSSTDAATSSSTDAATTSSTDAATSSSTDAATTASTDAATSSSTDAATTASTDAATSSSTDAATTA